MCREKPSYLTLSTEKNQRQRDKGEVDTQIFELQYVGSFFCDCENISCTFSTLQVQKTQHIISNTADLLFFYQSLFLYSLCLADVAGRFKAVLLSLFLCVCNFFVVFFCG